MAERRLNRLVDSSANGGLLPPFLIEDGGLNSGFMLVQYTAAALCSENKALVHPATGVDRLHGHEARGHGPHQDRGARRPEARHRGRSDRRR